MLSTDDSFHGCDASAGGQTHRSSGVGLNLVDLMFFNCESTAKGGRSVPKRSKKKSHSDSPRRNSCIWPRALLPSFNSALEEEDNTKQ